MTLPPTRHDKTGDSGIGPAIRHIIRIVWV